jgi:hypothetical protein
MEPVRGQDDRKRERHAMDGVWLPAGGRQPGTRRLSRQSAYAKARDCQGGGLFPLGPPPFARGEQEAIACKAEPDQSELSRIKSSRFESR